MLDGVSRLRVPMPPIGFGAAQLGNLFRETSDDEAADAVDAAWEGGIRYYDTAPHYGLGLSERRLGAALAGRPRAEMLVSTKVGRLLVPSPDTAELPDDEGFAVPASTRRVWDFSADGVRRSLDASLDRLGLDRIDIVYLHDPDDHWGRGVRLRRAGARGPARAGCGRRHRGGDEPVRDAGGVRAAPRHRPGHARRAVHAARPERARRPAPAWRWTAASASSPPGSTTPVCSASRGRPPAAMYDYQPAPPELVDRARRLAAVCEAHGVELPTAAIQFPLRHPAVVSVVVGARTADQVRVNARATGDARTG